MSYCGETISPQKVLEFLSQPIEKVLEKGKSINVTVDSRASANNIQDKIEELISNLEMHDIYLMEHDEETGCLNVKLKVGTLDGENTARLIQENETILSIRVVRKETCSLFLSVKIGRVKDKIVVSFFNIFYKKTGRLIRHRILSSGKNFIGEELDMSYK